MGLEDKAIDFIKKNESIIAAIVVFVIIYLAGFFIFSEKVVVNGKKITVMNHLFVAIAFIASMYILVSRIRAERPHRVSIVDAWSDISDIEKNKFNLPYTSDVLFHSSEFIPNKDGSKGVLMLKVDGEKVWVGLDMNSNYREYSNSRILGVLRGEYHPQYVTRLLAPERIHTRIDVAENTISAFYGVDPSELRAFLMKKREEVESAGGGGRYERE